MGPGVGDGCLESMREALADLHGERVVEALYAVLILQHALVAWVDAIRREIHGSGKRSNGIPTRVVDGVSSVRSGRADVQVAHREQLHAAAPDVGGRDGGSARDLALECECTLLRIRSAQVRVGELNGGTALGIGGSTAV